MAIRALDAYILKHVVTGLIEKITSLEWSSSRTNAISAIESFGVPSATEELWRYTNFEDAEFDSFEVRGVQPATPDDAVADLAIVDGWLVAGADAAPAAWNVKTVSPESIGVDFFSATGLAIAPHQILIAITEDADISIAVTTTANKVASPQIKIEAAEGVQARVAITLNSEIASMCLPNIEVKVGARSNTNVAIDSQGSGSSLVGHLNASVESQALATIEVVGGDTELSRYATEVHLVGRGAGFKMVSPSYLTGTQSSDHRVLVNHEAKDTTSDLLFRNVIDGQSKSIYSGVVKIHESGAGTNAVQENRTLSLSDDAWAHSVPNLEIENNEVACAHASTVSPIDYDQQFYLQSRGLTPEVADEAIVRGFLADVISKLASPTAKARVQEIVDHQIGKHA